MMPHLAEVAGEDYQEGYLQVEATVLAILARFDFYSFVVWYPSVGIQAPSSQEETNSAKHF